MAARLARSAQGAARLLPSTPVRSSGPVLLAAHQHQQTRQQSNVPQQDPKSRAQSLVDALPGNSLLSKTAILSSAAGLSVAAISNELFVVNEEAITAFSLLTIFYAVGMYGGPMYKEWADGQNTKIKNLLNSARKEHTDAVKKRMESVKDLGGVVDITKNLFAVSKETVEVEAKVYELEQKTALATEVRHVLDSWVRYEGQVKARQQKELADTIIAKIDKELDNPKVLKQILDQSVSDVERILSTAK